MRGESGAFDGVMGFMMLIAGLSAVAALMYVLVTVAHP